MHPPPPLCSTHLLSLFSLIIPVVVLLSISLYLLSFSPPSTSLQVYLAIHCSPVLTLPSPVVSFPHSHSSILTLLPSLLSLSISPPLPHPTHPLSLLSSLSPFLLCPDSPLHPSPSPSYFSSFPSILLHYIPLSSLPIPFVLTLLCSHNIFPTP